ncbi:urease accessory protein UreD [Acrocarpospora catenulata]|uniref:urease accessory protein UreD n=1 Tax=Acrocarpospora catenulata TaxID=2836182 RepID=UPI001BDB0F69|nr:urease accessory protein UreD [Acrocarpospora catenulata]
MSRTTTRPAPDTLHPARAAVRAHAAIATTLDGGATRLTTLRSDPPLTLRQTGPTTVHLVATAAGPLGGDHLELDLDVAAGTTLTVCSVAGTLVLPGPGTSVLTVRARVDEGASLRFAPEPTVLAAGCAHRSRVRLSLAEDATVLWREEIVFGRYGERPGRCHSRFDATVAGTPLLRQEFTVGDPATDDSPAVYGEARCVGSTLLTRARPESSHLAEGCAVLPLAGPGTLVSALAPDAVRLRERLEWGEQVALQSRFGGSSLP